MKPLPNLRHLKYLVALADMMNFSRAAEACSVTQSTLSAGIKEVELLLGGAVAERNKRRVILTPLGTIAVEKARELLELAEEFTVLAEDGSEAMSGRLEIGVIPTIGPYLLPRFVPYLGERYPDLKLGLREDKTAALLERLHSGQLDAVLMAFPYEVEGFETLALFDDPYHFVCNPSHPAAGDPVMPSQSVPDQPLLLLEKDHCLHAHALPLLEQLPQAQHNSFSATSLHTLVAMVGEGLGCTLLPDLAVRAGIHHAGMSVALPISGQPGTRQIGLAWRKRFPRAKVIRKLGEALKAFHDDSLAVSAGPATDLRKAG